MKIFMMHLLLVMTFFIRSIHSAVSQQISFQTTSVSQAIKKCDKNKNNYFAEQLTRAPACVDLSAEQQVIQKISLEYLSADLTSRSLQKACQGPVDFACELAKKMGPVVDSHCKLVVNQINILKQTPEYEKFEQEKQRCRGGDQQCVQKIIYSPLKMKKANDVLNQVKTMLSKVILSSKKISKNNLVFLSKKIEALQIEDPHLEAHPSACTQIPTPEDHLSFEISTFPEEHGNSRLTFCAGAMLALDRMPEVSLVYTLAHELSHLIDPCVMDNDGDLLPVPLGKAESYGSQLYGTTLSCLHGGKGPGGCIQSQVKCNDPGELKQLCLESKSPQDCQDKLLLFPNCAFSRELNSKTNSETGSIQDLKKPVNQIQEAFADFLAAEVMSFYVVSRDRKEGLSGLAEEKAKLDDLLALGEDFSTLHGNCQTKDASLNGRHPSGKTRVNWIFLGNKKLNSYYCDSHPTAIKPNGCDGI